MFQCVIEISHKYRDKTMQIYIVILQIMFTQSSDIYKDV